MTTPSNSRRHPAWTALDRACRLAGRPGRQTVDDLLRLALEASGAERAFLIRGREDPRGRIQPTVDAAESRRKDGRRQPSRTVALSALARPRANLWSDLARDRELAEGASVRSLDLRSVLSAPLPAQGRDRRALVLDSRAALIRPPAIDLVPFVECFASLIAQLAPAAVDSTLGADPEFVGSSLETRRMLEWARRTAGSGLPVLVRGETGSGKEGVARLIHRYSARSAGPFVAVNCTALAETLLEAELFGASRGAYTGSIRDRRGLLQVAEGGTLLLDEVGDMSSAMQAKLLRALEERRVRPVGAEYDQPIDVRIVAATHRDLARLAWCGRFRADLYYRLAVLEVVVPPLRARLADLPRLVASLAPRLARDTGFAALRLTDGAWSVLREHAWPGNVRELHAVLARALLRSRGAPIEPCHVVELITGTATAPRKTPPPAGLERQMVEAALREAGGSIAAAAREIGWSRQKLYRRMEALGIGD